MMKQICRRCVMDDERDKTFRIDEYGYCNYCTDTLKRLPSEYFPNAIGRNMLDEIMDKIKADGSGGKYDCMVGISGGVDSSYVIYLGHQYGLRMLAVHVDDGLDTEIAMQNIDKICRKTKTDLIMIKPPDLNQYRDLIRSFFLARVPNIAMPQDNIIAAAINDAAKRYNIKYNLSGGNFSLECILERSTGVNALDTRHIHAIHKLFGRGNIDKLRLATFFEEYIYGRYFNKTTKVLPLNFIDYNLKRILDELSVFCDYNYYNGKHHESKLTRFLQCYYLPVKYKFDKRKSHFSSMIVSGQMTRTKALEELSKDPYLSNELKENDLNFIADYLGMTRKEFDDLLALPAKEHQDYPVSIINKFSGIARKFRKYLGTSG